MHDWVRIMDMWVEAAYLYHIKAVDSGMDDSQFDGFASELLKNWDDYEHPMKELIGKDGLGCGSCFHLKDEQYPEELRTKYS
jgi:hypothetical protein